MREFHPVAEIFPLMQGREFDELVADIREHGLREPIVLHQDGRVIDGRNRARACEELDLEPDAIFYTGGDGGLVAFVVSLNLHRRHLNESQRAMVAAKLANLDEGRPQKTPQICGVSQGAAADMLKVSERSVTTAKTVQKKGAPELIDAVQEGKASLNAAQDVASLPKEEQAEIVAKGEKEILEKAKAIRQEKAQERKEERARRAAEMATKAANLAGEKTYRVIYADPPWAYNDKRDDAGLDAYTGAGHHYPTMTIPELCDLPIRDLAQDDAVLFLWVTSPLLYDAAPLIEAWGFKYKACFVWDKISHNVGHYNSVRHEFLLICTRGSCTPDVPKLHDSVVSIDRTKHSAKPEEFRELIDGLYPNGARIELFRRGDAPEGWDIWGNEADAAA